MLPQLMIRDWARRLLASEVNAESASAKTERVYEKLRTQLCAPVGVDGFQALASRALVLAKSQSPRLREVQVLARGSLSGLSDLDRLELEPGKDGDGEVGLILIEQLLGVFLMLLGEGATTGLIASVPFRVEVTSPLETTVTSASAPSTNYFGPFDDILSEADHLREVSERLEALANKHAGITEVMSVAGSIRNIAAVLDVFTVIRSKAGHSQATTFSSPPNGHLH